LKGFGEVDGLYGGEGEDVLYSHADSDYMLGGSGNDKLFGGPGMFPDGFVSDDQLRGGPGNDQLDGGSGDDTYELYGGFGHDRVTDASGDDYLAFESEDGLVIDLTPGAKPNVIRRRGRGPSTGTVP
jgi:Ca2+-binding RTX toxin-like protein